ncbi:hypothetical protein ASPCAL09499 [Aspergillus calidoustus]|jgi:nucleolar protein TMA23|uniref:G-patch domain-containing protein n=1 Tax=Aspergillus calidoustus TaxID=454130 RepID=A0A0U5GTB8_ASPCI|nr:hypothetical protein ASPCAL09499 [Aspergillus calidoustus]
MLSPLLRVAEIQSWRWCARNFFVSSHRDKKLDPTISAAPPAQSSYISTNLDLSRLELPLTNEKKITPLSLSQIDDCIIATADDERSPTESESTSLPTSYNIHNAISITKMTTISTAPQKKIDPYAYLIRHGWSGTGNPLNPDRAGGSRGGLGLTKPILVARRSGNQGVGKKTTKDPTNQWWLRGFEDALKGVGTDAAANAASGSTAGKANALTSELYRFFVRGEVIRGTLGDDVNKGDVVDKAKTKKRKRDEGDEGVRETKEEKRKRKEEKRARKAEKEARREARRVKKEEKRAKKEKKALRALAKKRPEEDYPTPVSMDLDPADNGQGAEMPLDLEKLAKLKKKEKKEKKKDKEGKKVKSRKQDSSSSDETSKRKSKKSKTS